ncbi:hypothetical protein GGF46_003148 [Coemansia sp. RSA 552]|nr:hypothetical protein GGF46_003148 [Coemansia sp. RSA 552]
MSLIETSAAPRSRLPRPLMAGLSGIARVGSHQSHLSLSGLGIGSGLSQDAGGSLAPSREKSAMLVYGASSGTTVAYIESVFRELSLKASQRMWNYGVVIGDSSVPLRNRIRVNSEPVESELFKECSAACADEAESSSSSSNGAGEREQAPPLGPGTVDAMLTNIALRAFDKENVTTAIIALACRPEDLDNAAGEGSSDMLWSVERLVLELFQPKMVICCLEAMPVYAERLPSHWHRGLAYLARQPVHVISSVQPKPVRVQLEQLEATCGIAIETPQPLMVVPACKDLRLGIFGPDQHQYAALALAACQAWAQRHGLLRSRTHSPPIAHSPVSTPGRQTPQSTLQIHAQAALRDAPPWMLRGLSAARCPGYFYTAPMGDKSQANWHYCWAETPGDFARTGAWFNSVCQNNSANPRILLIHFPESFVKTVQYRREADGKLVAADYRELLQSLYPPLRDIAWTCCVFAADILHESHVIESNVPPVLSQYVLREFWAQLTGLRTDQIFIAPSLLSARRLIESKCATHLVSMSGKTAGVPPGTTESPSAPSLDLGSQSMIFEPSSVPKPAQLLRSSPSASNLHAPSPRPSRPFTKSAAMRSSTSIDNLTEGRGKQLPGLGGPGNESTASLPLRTPRKNAPLPPPPASAIHYSNVDILVTGSRSFVQSTLFIAQQ